VAFSKHLKLLAYALRRVADGLWSFLGLTAVSSAIAAAYPWPMKLLWTMPLATQGRPPRLRPRFES
jgi:hypothetical protein